MGPGPRALTGRQHRRESAGPPPLLILAVPRGADQSRGHASIRPRGTRAPTGRVVTPLTLLNLAALGSFSPWLGLTMTRLLVS
jgi:hypothetical protein